MLKRASDLFVAGLGLLFLWPLLLLIAIAIRITSSGPALYAQERVSRDGKIFKMYKFRTMPVDTEKESGPVWATSEDKRPTPLGSLLRRSSLDELPQLFNVLNGSMSFIGPRPERPYFVEQFQNQISNYTDRHQVKAGMTGLAQINGLRGDTSIEQRVALDLYYIENWSLLLDLKIVLKSFWVIFQDFIYKKAY
jgi:putative colanic acid biosysnthesis UDP-glucose lipid carrier transferase